MGGVPKTWSQFHCCSNWRLEASVVLFLAFCLMLSTVTSNSAPDVTYALVHGSIESTPMKRGNAHEVVDDTIPRKRRPDRVVQGISALSTPFSACAA